MENKLLPNNVTLARLRRLTEATENIVDSDEAVNITLSIWHYNNIRNGHIDEKLGIYHSEGGPTKEFPNLKEAQNYLEKLKKQKKGEI